MNLPREIKKIGKQGIKITWSDGKVQEITSRTLREYCPSADSLAKRGDSSHEKPLSGKASSLKVISATIEEETQLEEIWAVGNYALGMRWADGHDTGIYTYEYLSKLAQLNNTGT